MIIENVGEEFLNCGRNEKKQELMDFAVDLWNEIVGMEKLENDPDYFGDGGDDSDEFDMWYNVPVEDIIHSEGNDGSKK